MCHDCNCQLETLYCCKPCIIPLSESECDVDSVSDTARGLLSMLGEGGAADQSEGGNVQPKAGQWLREGVMIQRFAARFKAILWVNL